ncbi:MAG: hypothetical protein AB7U82_33680, partial [Blastocatellales bacterium]
VKRGVIDGTLGDDLILAATIAIPTLIWSIWQKYKDRLNFVTALGLPANSTEGDVKAVIDRGGGAHHKLLTILLLATVGFAGLATQACGKEQIENTLAKTVTAMRAARRVTTVQHKYSHLDDAAYKARLDAFDRAYTVVDEIGDDLAAFGEITPGNKQRVLDKIGDLTATFDQLLASGDLGVKNPASQNDYRRWLMAARGGLASIKVVVAAVSKPTPVRDVRVPKTRD